MSEQVVTQVAELLNQEKWTRTALPTYTIQSFKDLDAILEQVHTSGDESESLVLALCDEHLATSRNSVTALYLAGMINLGRQSINDGNMISLINVFMENNRLKIAEYLAENMLTYGENRYALRTLAACFEAENKIDLKYEIWERLVRADPEEADIAWKLAVHYESQDALESAISFYKKSLLRFITKKLFSNVRENWKKLLQLCPDDVDFFLHAEGKIAKYLGKERGVMILEELYPVWKEAGHWELTLDILKRIAAYDPKNAFARKEIIDCYRAMHKDHSMLEDYIQLSNLNNTWRNIFDAIADFEKHIAFDGGNWVFHRTWGLGRIVSVKDDFITIDFMKQKGHKMSLKLAVNALTILAKDHFWVQLTQMSKEEMQKKVKTDIVWALKTVIKSFGNAADIKRIKAELCPRILSDNEWTTWSSNARKILKTDKSFGNLPDKPDVYVVRDKPITLEEKTFNRFRAEKDFFNRIKILQEYLSYLIDQSETLTVDTEQFREMVSYFVGFIKNPSQASENVVAAYALVHGVVAKYPFLNPGPIVSFVELYEAIEDVKTLFSRINNADLRREFLTIVRHQIKDWRPVYVALLPQHLQKEIVHELFRHGFGTEVQNLFLNAMTSYKDNREIYVWFVRSFIDEEWFVNLGIEAEKIVVSFIHLLDLCSREMEGKKDLVENRRLVRQINTFLFKEGFMEQYVSKADKENLVRIYSLFEDVKDIDQLNIKLTKTMISKFHADFDFSFGRDKSTEIETVARGGFFTMAKSYEEKQRALQVLLEVEVPKNSKEIGVARDYGDLRENAEYKAAKERQEILNATAARWKEELEQAKIFNPDEVDTSKVSFGTTVSLLNGSTKKTETYTIMGPWESNPDESVISYLSPFGKELFKKPSGTKLTFTINERKYIYTVKTIKKADFTKIKTTTPVTL